MRFSLWSWSNSGIQVQMQKYGAKKFILVLLTSIVWLIISDFCIDLLPLVYVCLKKRDNVTESLEIKQITRNGTKYLCQ